MDANRFHNLPEEIETERLLLRPPRPGDGVAINAAIQETYAELHQWMEWADHLPSLEEAEANCLRFHQHFLEGSDFPIRAYLKDSGDFVLGSGLHPRDWSVPRFEIGYWCRASMQGRGYVAEAVRAITRFAFETAGAKRVEIRCDPRNVRSRAVAERAGYTLEGIFRHYQVAPDGGLRDTCVYALLPHEHMPSHTE